MFAPSCVLAVCNSCAPRHNGLHAVIQTPGHSATDDDVVVPIWNIQQIFPIGCTNNCTVVEKGVQKERGEEEKTMPLKLQTTN
jgi:hypothetical protein